MKKIRITQIKSGIDRPERQKLTLRALGLNKMNASREVEATAQILGMVRAVNHLIRIEETAGGDVQEVVPATEARIQETKKKSVATESDLAPVIPITAANEVTDHAADISPVLPEDLSADVSDKTIEEPTPDADDETPSSEVFPKAPATDVPSADTDTKISPEEPIK